MNVNKNILAVCLALVLTGCGGGSGGSSTPNPDTIVPPPAADALPGGHWFGTVTDNLNVVTEEYLAMVDENGRFRFISVDSAVQMSGNFSIVGDNLVGDGTAFADANISWLDGSSATPVTIAGTITGRSEM
ncbi:MAG: hypothetical protein MUO51_05420, partial [Woeseiaceae bacterium]|nr:hypothetical protein [Woeseiaceae bacterium]